jgi:hypothetical protein
VSLDFSFADDWPYGPIEDLNDQQREVLTDYLEHLDTDDLNPVESHLVHWLGAAVQSATLNRDAKTPTAVSDLEIGLDEWRGSPVSDQTTSEQTISEDGDQEETGGSG